MLSRRDQLPVKETWMLNYLDKRRAAEQQASGLTVIDTTTGNEGGGNAAEGSDAMRTPKMPERLRSRIITGHVEGELSNHLAASGRRESSFLSQSFTSVTSAASFRGASALSPAQKLRRAKGVAPQSSVGAIPFAAALGQDFSAVQERVLLTSVDEITAAHRRTERQHDALIRIVAFFRMAVMRRRFLLHTSRVKAEVAALVAQRNIRCAISVQRVVRGMVCRLRYRRQREEEALRALEASKKAGGKGKGGAAAASGAKGGVSNASIAAGSTGLSSLMSPQDVALQQNASFIQGMRSYFAGRWDEAQTAFELQLRHRPGDQVANSMLDLAKRRREAAVGGIMNRSASTMAASTSGGKTPATAKAPAAGTGKKK